MPFGRYKRPYFPQDELYHFAEKAQNAEFYCLSYEECMELAGAKHFQVKVRRSISSNGGTRKKVDELLALYRP